MPDERPSIPAGVASSTTSDAVPSESPFPLRKPAILGVVSCIVWLATPFADLWEPAGITIPAWLRVSTHLVLVLAPLIFTLIWLKSPRESSRVLTRWRALGILVVEALALLILALLALVPSSTPSDLIILPVRVPTLSLGAALAFVDPRLRVWRRTQRGPDPSVAVVAGISFGPTCVAAAILLFVLARFSEQSVNTCRFLTCRGLEAILEEAVCAEAFFCALTGLLGAWIGYALGGLVAQVSG